MSIKIYEGERARAKDNHLIGKFDLSGIPPAPRGVPKIEVSFEVDENSILTVAAKDKGTGKKRLITITNNRWKLTKEEIEKMIKDSEKFAKKDKEIKDKLETRN